MTDFTKDELEVLASAIDMMVRTEGNAMAQAGSGGLKEDRVMLLSRRLKLGMSALAKLEATHAALVEAEKAEEANKPQVEGG